MNGDKKRKQSKVTLDIELQDLLNVVSNSSGGSISEQSHSHMVEGEELKKAWFKHMLISMEKLNDLIETIRRVDIVNLRSEIKEDIRRLNDKIEKAEDGLVEYKKDVITPINNKVITLTVKLSVIGLLAGFVGSSVMTFILYLAKEYFIVGGP